MHHENDQTSSRYAERRRVERRVYPAVLALALGISGLIHLITLLTVSFETPYLSRYQPQQPPELVEVAPVMRAYDLVTVDTEVPPIEAQIEERQLLREAERTFIRAPSAVVPAFRPPTERRPSAPVHERLQYREGSVREIWRPATPAEAGELTPAERVERRVASALAPYNDSIAAVEAARERALDWTTTDAEGRRWGVSPGKIHLGSITIPTQAGKPTDWLGDHLSPMGRSEEVAKLIRDYNAIRIQAANVTAREAFDERVKAIRERMDAERKARMSGDTTGSAAARPGGG